MQQNRIVGHYIDCKTVGHCRDYKTVGHCRDYKTKGACVLYSSTQKLYKNVLSSILIVTEAYA